ncbi:hypothetical protein [Lysinibacillus cavernae]|uniref:hypothetical protein n=1 Tax=Lysinibacillus cavernae TaxID=2666135 RepID=UPI0012D9CA9D|nr:hypothetical protein [Lysinibacillus cavernae]
MTYKINKSEDIIDNKIIEKNELINPSEYFLTLYRNLDNFELERCMVLKNLEIFLRWNKQTQHISEDKLQKLWMKLIRKHKFSLDEWESNAAKTNIHSYLVKEQGHGLQKLLRFYKERHGIKWLENAFDYGLTLLIKGGEMPGLEMFFLTNLICYKWEIDYLEDADVQHFFCHSINGKVKEVYDSFRSYVREQNLLTATKLHKLLSKYNPHFHINSAATPKFYKELALFIEIN